MLDAIKTTRRTFMLGTASAAALAALPAPLPAAPSAEPVDLGADLAELFRQEVEESLRLDYQRYFRRALNSPPTIVVVKRDTGEDGHV